MGLSPCALQPDAAPAACRCRALADELDAERVERADQLGEGIHITPDDAVTRLHALDGRRRQPGMVGQGLLVDAEEGPRGPKLRGSYHM